MDRNVEIDRIQGHLGAYMGTWCYRKSPEYMEVTLMRFPKNGNYGVTPVHTLSPHQSSSIKKGLNSVELLSMGSHGNPLNKPDC